MSTQMRQLMMMVEAVDPSPTRTMFHVTPTRNLPAIMRDGLVPKLGKRSRAFGEPVAAIYLFPSQDDAEEAVMNWLGDEFDDGNRLALVSVTLPPSIEVEQTAGYEFVTRQTIPPDCIDIVTRDL